VIQFIQILDKLTKIGVIFRITL